MEIIFFIVTGAYLIFFLYISHRVWKSLRLQQIKSKFRSAMGKDIKNYLDKIVLIKAKDEDDDDCSYVLCIENIRVKPDCILFDTEFCLKDDEPKGGYCYFTFNPSRYHILELDCDAGYRQDYHRAYIKYLLEQPIELSEILTVDETGKLKVKFA